MASDLVAAWRMGHEANLLLLDHLTADALTAAYSPRTRTVAAQFAHMHAVRLRWLAHAAPDLTGGITTFERGAQPTRAALVKALQQSSRAVEAFLEASEAGGRVKAWSGPPATFLGYLVAHEAHHRGLAMAALRVAGHKLPDEVVYGSWDWGKKRSARGATKKG